ncbi:MAG TPA: SAF domain-containing protein, partial [Ornithinibacter sp.]|nr:SAF domain-containing protein [Ornithinibacter sp.]
MVRPPLPALTGSGRRSRWRRSVLRRVLAAGLVGVSLALVVRELRPPPAPTVGVVVAGTAIPAGAVLTAAHLRTARVPVEGAQPGALTRVEEAAGRRVGSGLDAGETVTTRRLVPRGPADGLRPGRVALHVVASDPASVDLLAPGTWTRVYPVSGGAVISRAAEVLAV